MSRVGIASVRPTYFWSDEMIGWAIYELTPAPWGDDYRFIVIRDTEEAANEILNLLNKTDYSFSVYKIVEFKR